MATAIEFQNVGKMYRLGRVGTGTLSHDLNRWWQMSVLGKEDPYLKIGQTNDRTTKGESDYVWALRDISFKVEQGEVLGIIGKNGAGKSTLLKLLSNITSPSTGMIKYNGRIASLLEVGTGFHPEMTGRENIYMNGSIMGMTKHEITRKLDEIVDFAGVERYLDTPVKRYSSGMTVRLGFAVAAFLEPEILVVDEVLTVGDAEFQKKAIGKMQDVSKGEGRTVLFVSHNMASVRRLCTSGVVLKNGMIDTMGNIDDCIDAYTRNASQEMSFSMKINPNKHRESQERKRKDFVFTEVSIVNPEPSAMGMDEPILLDVSMDRISQTYDKLKLSAVILNDYDQRLCFYLSDEISIPKDKQNFTIRLNLANHNLPRGIYKIKLEANLRSFSRSDVTFFDSLLPIVFFEVRYFQKKALLDFNYWRREWGVTLHEGKDVDAVLI